MRYLSTFVIGCSLLAVCQKNSAEFPRNALLNGRQYMAIDAGWEAIKPTLKLEHRNILNYIIYLSPEGENFRITYRPADALEGDDYPVTETGSASSVVLRKSDLKVLYLNNQPVKR